MTSDVGIVEKFFPPFVSWGQGQRLTDSLPLLLVQLYIMVASKNGDAGKVRLLSLVYN